MRQVGCGRVSLSSKCTGNLWELSLEAQQGECLSLSSEKMWPGYEEKEKNPKTLPGSVSLPQCKQCGLSGSVRDGELQPVDLKALQALLWPWFPLPPRSPCGDPQVQGETCGSPSYSVNCGEACGSQWVCVRGGGGLLGEGASHPTGASVTGKLAMWFSVSSDTDSRGSNPASYYLTLGPFLLFFFQLY